MRQARIKLTINQSMTAVTFILPTVELSESNQTWTFASKPFILQIIGWGGWEGLWKNYSFGLIVIILFLKCIAWGTNRIGGVWHSDEYIGIANTRPSFLILLYHKKRLHPKWWWRWWPTCVEIQLLDRFEHLLKSGFLQKRLSHTASIYRIFWNPQNLWGHL